MDLEIVPLTVERFDDLAALFSEGGDPKWCWCAYWRLRSKDWSASSPTKNKAMLRSLASRSVPPGLLAYEGERAVGWVGVAPREAFDRLEHSRVRPRLDDVPVWSIVCFVVSKAVRGRGVAGRLLDAAIEHARAAGAPALEAYPVDPAAERVADNMAYTGALSTFLAAGFREVRSVDSPTATVRRVIVRKEL
ncbi:MAG TPA: GNAT family N-acetyltransferase [Candidatus Limnocylindrales bacterium]|nr:GNAT family N-acetyltransferase [Candidatus Limnocylindrales bacterium]